jgi:ABC-type hemin transport system ATPase subunit
VLVVVHDLNLAARACDRVVLLDEGLVVAARAAEEVLTEARLRATYQADVHVHAWRAPDRPRALRVTRRAPTSAAARSKRPWTARASS